MTRHSISFLFAGGAAFALCSCSAPAQRQAAATSTPSPTASPSASSTQSSVGVDTAEVPPSKIVPMVSPVASPDGVNDGYPDLTPVPSKPEVERTAKGARNVLLSFARAIELKEFDQAWHMLGKSAQKKWSMSAFNKLFAGLDHISVAVPDGRMEGSAGSSYYTSQATITAKDADGRPVRIEGPITLRRVNDVPGATPYQLHWHIEQLKLDWTH